MTQVPGDLIINQNIMFAGKMEVTQAVSFSWAYDFRFQFRKLQILVLFRFFFRKLQ